MATTAGSPAAARLLPYFFIIALLQPLVAAARPLAPAARAACAGTGVVQPVPLSKPLPFCGGEIGDSTCCGEAKDAALHRAFLDAFSGSFKIQQDASCAAIVKNTLCAACFPAAGIPVDTSLPAPCAALANKALLSSSIEHLSRSSAPDALPSNNICLEKVAAVSYSGLIVAPDGSGRVIVWNQQGEVWLASMPAAADVEMQTTGAATPMRVDGSLFIDLSSLVSYDEARGLRGLISVVPHPRMDRRLFVSYTTTTSDDDSGAKLVVEELSPGERGFEGATVFSMDLPAAQAQGGFLLLDDGGKLFFRPNDQSLYLITGHGVSADLVSSNKSTLLGKIIRLHVDHDVPGTDVEVFFSGLNTPRGCTLDYYGSLYCANIDDETQRELVYLILDNSTFVVVLDLERPTIGMVSAPIVWGLQYQGSADTSIGRYIYAYNSAIWSTTVESPPKPSSGHQTTAQMLVACSRTTPMPCQDVPIIVSFAEDQNKEGVILATDGVYRIVASSLCTSGPLAAAPAPASRLPVGDLVAMILGPVGTVAFLLGLWWMVYSRIGDAEGSRDSTPCFECCRRGCTCCENGCTCCENRCCW